MDLMHLWFVFWHECDKITIDQFTFMECESRVDSQ